MGFFRFRRSVKILPGVRWNINKGGSSFTFGGRGYHYTVGNKGSRTTVGLPGTGISYTQIHSSSAKSQKTAPTSLATQMPPTTQKPGISKAGCLYAAGLTVLGIWLLSFLGKTQSTSVTAPTAPSPSATRAEVSPIAALVTNVAPTSVPQSSVTVLRATRVRSPAEEARIQKYVPSRVTLKQDVEFLATTPNAAPPAYYVGQGKEVALVRVNGPNLVVGYQGRQATVPVAKTDFLDRVIAEADK
ncbi:MAG: hypothetical protein QOK24_2719 [Verrucomicrobiota bacterium]|jgi:hypothetical protein